MGYRPFKFFFVMFFTSVFMLYGGYKYAIRTDDLLTELQRLSPIPCRVWRLIAW